MKALVAVPLIWVALAVLWFLTIGPPPASGDTDLGEPSPLVSACHFAEDVGLAQGLTVTSCRADVEAGDIEYRHGTRAAVVPVVVRANGVSYHLKVFVQKSLWSGSAFAQ